MIATEYVLLTVRQTFVINYFENDSRQQSHQMLDSVGLHSMFGMSDPTQTLLQLENYVKDGRLEMSEVMATQFTDMFLSNKKRTQSEQILLIRGLQILVTFY